MEFLGVELWDIIVKLSAKHSRNYSRFESEVARRTASPSYFRIPSTLHHQDGSDVRTSNQLLLDLGMEENNGGKHSVMGKFVQSPLFAFLCGRYNHVWDHMAQDEMQEEIESATKMVGSFYTAPPPPLKGTTHSSRSRDNLEAIQTITGMLPISILPVLSEVVSKSATMIVTNTQKIESSSDIVFTTTYQVRPVSFQSGDAFKPVLLNALLKHSVIPKKWWMADLLVHMDTSPLSTIPRLCKVKMMCDPITLVLCTSSPASCGKIVGHVIHLEEHLDASTTNSAISTLAKMVCKSFQGVFVVGALISSPSSGGMNKDTPLVDIASKVVQYANTELYKYIVQLQKIIKAGGSIKGAGATASPSMQTPFASASASEGDVTSSGPNKADIGLLYRDPEKALENVDLQDADEFTLQEFKNKMTEKFSKRVVKPGDPNYVYDKRVEIKAEKASEWDDSDDE